MGWKSIKDHYKIEHIVTCSNGVINIGSSYILDIISISADGKILKPMYAKELSPNADIRRIYREMAGDPVTLARLAQQQDVFSAKIPVYTYSGGEVLEKYCEAVGWPNVTHDGLLMYENMFFPTWSDALKLAIENANAFIALTEHELAEIESETIKTRERLEDWKSKLLALLTLQRKKERQA